MMDLITESLGIMMSGEQEIPDVPDGYEQLDYVICPQSGQAGFEVTGYTAIKYDMHECKTSPYQIQSEAAFAGNIDNYITFELYYKGGGIKSYTINDALRDVLIPNRDAEIGNDYLSRVMIGKTLPGNLAIGYWDLNSYRFSGKIYYYKIWRQSSDSETTLIYDFVPAKRVSDDKVGMYEKVNGVFYPSTTGTDFQAPTAE